MRKETDSMGEIQVPADRYWGAQTQRSLIYFSIGKDLMPIEAVHAMAIIKKAAALANHSLGKLSKQKMQLVVQAADRSSKANWMTISPCMCG
jgi:fumarate hydratase class II